MTAFMGGRFEMFKCLPSELLRYRAAHVFCARIGRLRVVDVVTRRRLFMMARVAAEKERRDGSTPTRVCFDMSSSYPDAMLRDYRRRR